jgi:hypothetical protein
MGLLFNVSWSVFPRAYVQDHHRIGGSWEWLPIEGRIDEYKDDKGFELIANALDVERPSRPPQATRRRRARKSVTRRTGYAPTEDTLDNEREIEDYINTRVAKSGSR